MQSNEPQNNEIPPSPRPMKRLFREKSQSPSKNGNILIIENIRDLESAQKSNETPTTYYQIVIKPQDPSFFTEIIEKSLVLPDAERVSLNLANIEIDSNAKIITKFTNQMLGGGKIRLFELKGVNSHEFAQSLCDILREASSLTSFSIYQQENTQFDSTQEELEISLIKSLVANPNLESLEFKEISSSRAVDTLAQNLKSMEKLNSLKIHFRLENPDILHALFATLRDKKTLRSISLHFTDEMIIDNNNLSNLANMIKGLEELHALELTFKNANEGDSAGMQNLMKTIASRVELNAFSLHVAHCKGFDSEALAQITKGIKDMKKLTRLEFYCWGTKVSIDALCNFTQAVLEVTEERFLHLNMNIDATLLSHKDANAQVLKNNVIKLQNANATIVID